MGFKKRNKADDTSKFNARWDKVVEDQKKQMEAEISKQKDVEINTEITGVLNRFFGQFN